MGCGVRVGAAEGRFITTGGEPVFAIPMGRSAEEGYDNLLRAWNNEQDITGKEDRGSDEDAPVKRARTRREKKTARRTSTRKSALKRDRR
ncbi:unnamed protein product [marine sediment metagenome]|uniref:Uncharacterized protein n=1 Tax=marine sediment metagenome TaxID=412755 RepID=X0UPY5_9ZZZZ